MSKKKKLDKLERKIKKVNKVNKEYRELKDQTAKLMDAYGHVDEEIASLRKFICNKVLEEEYDNFEQTRRGEEHANDDRNESNREKVWKYVSELIQEDAQMRNEGEIDETMSESPKTTVREFCIHETRPRELCIFRRNGWITGATWIDHEDAFTISDSIKNKEVKSDEWGALSIVTEQGEPVDIPVHYIDY